MGHVSSTNPNRGGKSSRTIYCSYENSEPQLPNPPLTDFRIMENPCGFGNGPNGYFQKRVPRCVSKTKRACAWADIWRNISIRHAANTSKVIIIACPRRCGLLASTFSLFIVRDSCQLSKTLWRYCRYWPKL